MLILASKLAISTEIILVTLRPCSVIRTILSILYLTEGAIHWTALDIGLSKFSVRIYFKVALIFFKVCVRKEFFKNKSQKSKQAEFGEEDQFPKISHF